MNSNFISAPRNTPAAMVDKLNGEVNAAFNDPAFITQIRALGGLPLQLSPAAFGKFIADDTAKWGNVIRDANVTPN